MAFTLSRCPTVFPVFPDDFDPESERQIFPIRRTQLPPQFRGVALLQNIKIERDALSEKANVIAVLLAIPLQLGKS